MGKEESGVWEINEREGKERCRERIEGKVGRVRANGSRPNVVLVETKEEEWPILTLADVATESEQCPKQTVTLLVTK